MDCLNNNSFPKKLRIRKRNDFKDLFQKGKRFYTENFIIILKKNSENVPRLGIVVTRKYGKAVKRNRMKRLLREFFRLNKKYFKKGFDYLIIVKNTCKITQLKEIELELKDFLSNEKVINYYNSGI